MHNKKLKNKIYTNVLLILISGSIFYFVIYPKYSGKGTFYNPKDNISSLSDQKDGYDKAVLLGNTYLQKIAKTNSDYSNILDESQTDPTLSKADKILPLSADPILTIYDLSKIAKRPECGMLLSAPSFTSNENDKSNNKNYNTLTITFTLQGTYDNLKAFLKDLEMSEKVYNVTNLSFTSSYDTRATSMLKYNITVETYYLKQH